MSWTGWERLYEPSEQRMNRLPVVFDGQLVERQAEGVEEVEHRLLDHLGEAQEQRSVLLDRRLAGLDLPVLPAGDLQHLGHLLGRLAAALAVLADQLAGLAGVGVGGAPAVGEQAGGRGLQLDRDVGEQRSPGLRRRGSPLDLLGP